jgi:hypothetical protein
MGGMSHPMICWTGRRITLDDNKAFAAWVLLVVGGAGTLLLCLLLTGVAELPPLLNIAADVALGLSVRAAYKWVGGFEWADWSIAGESTGEAADDLHVQPGAPAGAMG